MGLQCGDLREAGQWNSFGMFLVITASLMSCSFLEKSEWKAPPGQPNRNHQWETGRQSGQAWKSLGRWPLRRDLGTCQSNNQREIFQRIVIFMSLNIILLFILWWSIVSVNTHALVSQPRRQEEKGRVEGKFVKGEISTSYLNTRFIGLADRRQEWAAVHWWCVSELVQA